MMTCKTTVTILVRTHYFLKQKHYYSIKKTWNNILCIKLDERIRTNVPNPESSINVPEIDVISK